MVIRVVGGSQEEAKVARIDRRRLNASSGLGVGIGTLTSESSSSPALLMVERNSSPVFGNADVMILSFLRNSRRLGARVAPFAFRSPQPLVLFLKRYHDASCDRKPPISGCGQRKSAPRPDLVRSYTPRSTGARRCSSTRRDRRREFLRGVGAFGLSRTSTSPFVDTPNKPKPSLRQRLRNLASLSRPLPRDERRAASQTSSQAAARSTPCKTSSRLKANLSSPITTTGGSSPFNANRSQPPTSPLTTKPSPSRKALTGR